MAKHLHSRDVRFDPEEPRCSGADTQDDDGGAVEVEVEHDWRDDGDPWGSDHGGVKFSETCSRCGLVRHTDTGATDMSNGERMESVGYTDAEGACGYYPEYADEVDEDLRRNNEGGL